MAYVTIDDFKAYAGHDDYDTDDTLVPALIARAQGVIDNYCGRTFEGSTSVGTTGSDGWVERNFDYSLDVDGYELLFDRDICEIGVVSNGDSDSTAISSDNYVTNPRNDTPYYSIKIKSSTTDSWTYADDPEDAITVSGVWAWSLTAPDPIKQATLRLTNWFYKQRVAELDADRPAVTPHGFTVMPAKIPADVVSIIEPYRKKRVYGF
jgi:hypothetical protein